MELLRGTVPKDEFTLMEQFLMKQSNDSQSKGSKE
jgi:hypothetical protein